MKNFIGAIFSFPSEIFGVATENLLVIFCFLLIICLIYVGIKYLLLFREYDKVFAPISWEQIPVKGTVQFELLVEVFFKNGRKKIRKSLYPRKTSTKNANQGKSTTRKSSTKNVSGGENGLSKKGGSNKGETRDGDRLQKVLEEQGSDPGAPSFEDLHSE